MCVLRSEDLGEGEMILEMEGENVIYQSENITLTIDVNGVRLVENTPDKPTAFYSVEAVCAP